jgi:hypothetical protein
LFVLYDVLNAESLLWNIQKIFSSSYSENIDKEKKGEETDGWIGDQKAGGGRKRGPGARQAGPGQRKHTWVRLRRKRKASSATAEAFTKVWAQEGRPPPPPPTAVAEPGPDGKALHRKKSFSIFPSPAGMSLTKLSLFGNYDVTNKLFLPRESLVSDIPAGDGNIEKLFLQCEGGIFEYWRKGGWKVTFSEKPDFCQYAWTMAGEKSCSCAVESEPDRACAAGINEKSGSALISKYKYLRIAQIKWHPWAEKVSFQLKWQLFR